MPKTKIPVAKELKLKMDVSKRKNIEITERFFTLGKICDELENSFRDKGVREKCFCRGGMA